eukprot:gene5622-41320_t
MSSAAEVLRAEVRLLRRQLAALRGCQLLAVCAAPQPPPTAWATELRRRHAYADPQQGAGDVRIT